VNSIVKAIKKYSVTINIVNRTYTSSETAITEADIEINRRTSNNFQLGYQLQK